MSLQAGARLGPYEILALIDAGAMGEVYRARDSRLGRDVAIKVLPAAFSGDADRLHRFEHEARAAAALNHPNILAVFDVGQHGDFPYIVSELLEGETLRKRLQSATPLSVRQAVAYAVQIANGLAAAHARGIVHRDLKPENIFITTDDRIKILDFGLAKLTQAEPPSSDGTVETSPLDTQPGMVMGTVGYMSPEQARGLAPDRRSDTFSFGAILYEMLSGRRAFEGASVADTMSAILKEHPPDLGTLEPHIPPILARVVERCLEKSPVARFQSTEDLAFALGGLSASSGIGTAAGSDGPGSPTRPASIEKRERLMWLAVSLVLLSTAIALAIVAFTGRPQGSSNIVRLSVPAPKGVVQIDLMLGISPDGSRLVFAATTSDGARRLWIRPLDAIDAYQLAGTEQATYPFWSPDSRSLGFFAEGKLKKIDVAGSATPVALCDAPQATGGAWNADGIIVFSNASRLFRVSAVGGVPVPLSGVNEGQEHSTLAYPLFLPDGRHFLYLDTGTGTESAGEAAIYAGALDSKDRTLLLHAVSNVWYAEGYLFFLREATLMARPFDATRLTFTGDAISIVDQVLRAGTIIGLPGGAFSASDRVLAYQTTEGEPGDATNLTWFDRTGKQMGVVGEPGDYGSVELSPDGKRLAVSTLGSGNSRHISLFDVERGIPVRLTLDASDDYTSVWSPDGSRVLFNSRRKGSLDLYEKASSGSGPEQEVLVNNRDKAPMSWSADGRFLLYRIGNGGAVGNQADLWVLPLTGDRRPLPVLQTPFDQFSGRFSPDGRWIAYTSNESGRSEVYVTSFPSLSSKARVSTAGGNWPRWRRDGKEILYLAPDATLMAAPTNGQGSQLQIGAVRPLFQTHWRTARGYPYDLTPDGQRFLASVASARPVIPPITLVVNWLADLKK